MSFWSFFYFNTPNDEYESFRPSYHAGLAHIPLCSPGHQYFNTDEILMTRTSVARVGRHDGHGDPPKTIK